MTSLHSSSSPFSIMDYMDMDIDMDSSLHVHDLDQLSASTTTTTPTDDYWDHWSPLLHLEDGLHHDFHSIIDSFLHDSSSILSPQQEEARPTQEAPYIYTSSSPNSSSPTDITLLDHHDLTLTDDFKGLRLVHLLMAAAEAISGGNNSHHLARVILIRLNHLVSPSHPSNMERLASSFTHALHSLLELPPNTNHKHLTTTSGPHNRPPMDMVAAFQLLQDMSPYLKFAHFTANQAILEAVSNDRRVHIVDFDIMEGIQWASLIQALASRPDGLPGPHLRITALSRTGVGGRKSISTVQETGRRLTAFAASVGQPFSFHQCRLDSDETFRPTGLKLVRGEALVFNCILHLPHLTLRPPESVASFLNGAKTLSPRLVTMVEEEAGPGRGEGGFVGRFMECLHHYSAFYDSLEAGIPMESGARTLVERVYLGPRIARSVARIYSEGGEEERPGSWGEWLGEMGYRGVAMSFSNQCQANLLLGLFNDGFKAEVFGSNRLVLSWRSRRLLSASLWTTS